jgi:hypothetical protein
MSSIALNTSSLVCYPLLVRFRLSYADYSACIPMKMQDVLFRLQNVQREYGILDLSLDDQQIQNVLSPFDCSV